MDHISVLKKQVLQYLTPQSNQNFIDCNVGLAGHALEILKRTAPLGKVLGIDLDKATLQKIENNQRLILIQDNFVNLKKIAIENNFTNVHGILFDLGFSSWQLEKSDRGFSFQRNEPLKMSYSDQDLSAQEIVNQWSEEEIADTIFQYGQERFSRRIAKRIVEQRKNKKIVTTGQLVEIIGEAVPNSYKHRKIHFATKTFQALRIAVNDELNNLKLALPQALEILRPKGRIVVISFHSLEDRIVKHFFKDSAKETNLTILTKKPTIADDEEIDINPRSRSAKLRAAQKI